MANLRMCPHVVTLFNFIKEDEERRAVYSATQLHHVHIFDSEGVQGLEDTDDEPRMHIFDDCVIAYPSDGVIYEPNRFNLSPYNLQIMEEVGEGERPFLEYDSWRSLKDQDKRLFWTLSPDGRDYFAKGMIETSNSRLPEGISLFRVKRVGRREIGSKRMWHWKVNAE